jgi:hypothetical protein
MNIKERIHEPRSLIEATEGKKPSLNNYLVAAFLDGSIEFADIDILKKKMRLQVLKMGKGEVLVDEDTWRRSEKTEEDRVKVNAQDLFIIPTIYKDALAEYENRKAEYRKKLADLESVRDALLLKINLGSNTILDKLIDQVDTMGDINLINNQMMLIAGKEEDKPPKKISKH